MSDVTAPAAAPSAPASTPSQTSTPSSVPSTSGSPVRSTTADLASKLYGGGSETAPSLDSQLETPDSGDVEQPSASDAWYETYKEVHGMPAQDILQALQEGRVPEALFDKLRFELRDGDDVTEVDLSTLQNGSMMQRAFTRKTQELANEKKAFFAERDEFADYLRTWKSDPQQLLYGLERLGMPVLESAKLLAERLTYADALNERIPGAGDQWLEAQKSQAELADLRRAQQAQIEQQQRAQQSDKQSKVRTNLQNASKQVFEQIGLKLEGSSWNLYSQHVQALYDMKPSGQQKLTRQDLERAARATKAQIDEYAQKYVAQKPKKAPGLGQTLDAGAPKGVPGRAPSKPGGKTTEQFLREMQERQHQRNQR